MIDKNGKPKNIIIKLKNGVEITKTSKGYVVMGIAGVTPVSNKETKE